MEVFFKALRPMILEAVRTAMEEIRRQAGSEHIYAAALVTDSDCVTLFLAVNTEERLLRRDAKDRTPKRLKELRRYWSEEKVRQIADGAVSLNRWLPDEWGYSDGTGSGLNQVSRLLFDKEASLSDAAGDDYDETCEQFQEQFLETVASAFETLREEGVFGPEVTCFISMSDDGRAPEIERASAQRLNSPELYEAFIKWMDFFL